MKLDTYLKFDGNCREAFEFYRSAFGGDFQELQTFADGPPDMGVADEYLNHLMHVSLPIGPSVLMGSDCVPGFGPPNVRREQLLHHGARRRQAGGGRHLCQAFRRRSGRHAVAGHVLGRLLRCSDGQVRRELADPLRRRPELRRTRRGCRASAPESRSLADSSAARSRCSADVGHRLSGRPRFARPDCRRQGPRSSAALRFGRQRTARTAAAGSGGSLPCGREGPQALDDPRQGAKQRIDLVRIGCPSQRESQRRFCLQAAQADRGQNVRRLDCAA